ncbi:MAG: SDR family NAD(P)-dependent oxidoreductase, partial [Xanthomonadales bacterium]|nr:SDR family NAD(P)-dependent oxidoreductase [Xanthomonadales bacterium]
MRIGENISAIVTGGASGLGEACARALRGRGAKVAVLDLQAERGQAVADEVGALFFETDVTSDESVAT